MCDHHHHHHHHHESIIASMPDSTGELVLSSSSVGKGMPLTCRSGGIIVGCHRLTAGDYNGHPIDPVIGTMTMTAITIHDSDSEQ